MIIRRVPADFRVEEMLSARFLGTVATAPRAGSACALYRLSKTSLTTPEAVQRLAASLKLSPGKVSYAGLKDKHAETVQHVSVPMSTRAPELTPRNVEGPGWRAELIGWTDAAIDAAAIARNRFTIVIRDIAADRSGELYRRATSLGGSPLGDAKLLIVNYFGDQRFGSARHGRGFAAAHLVRGEFEQALKLLIATPARKDSGKRRAFTRLAATKWGAWSELARALPPMPERRAVEVLAQAAAGTAAPGSGGDAFREAFAALPAFLQAFCVEAYQSHLWNAVARGMVEKLAREAPDGQMLRADDDFGEMLFPAAGLVPGAWMRLEVPMLAASVALQDPWGGIAAGVLASEGVSLSQLRVPGLRRPQFGEAMRPLIVAAERFQLGAAEPDDLGRQGRLKRVVSFDLPRGAYATVVLRAIGQ